MEGKKFQKSYFDVLGICCPSEIPLIVNILKPLDGVIEVNVIVPSRTVIVIHDDHIISQIQIVKALNSARLEANVRVYGEENSGNKWPKPYTIACGVLVAISTFKFLYHPLQWVGIAAVAVGIPPVLLRSIASIRSCSQNYTMDVNILVLIAVTGAVALGDYWEAGTVVFLFTIAEWLELRATQKANTVMSSLMSMAPQKAILAETGEAVDAKDVKIDTILAVKAGEVIPIDGIVVEGNCEVDEKSLTGESMPASKQTQSTVWAGTINLNGYISVRTTALAEDCVVAKMAKLVEEAQNSKSKSQRLVDKFAKYYTPAVMIASVSLVIVPAAMRKHNLKHWVHLALVVLVSACPCALILSTPIATFCAFTKAATSGILVKGGDYLETLAKIKTLAFDKTGTITRGEFLVTDFRSLRPDISLETLLYWVSSIESKASHPMAASLVDYAQLGSIEPKPENVKDFQNFPGEGIHGEIDGKSIYVGNRRIARRAGCDKVPPPGDDKEGGTFGYIISGEDLLGEFRMADTCRSGVLDAIKELKSLGIKTIMLTGDSQIAAMQVQEKLGHALDEIHAELLPEDKVRIIKDHKRDGPTAMIGDGVNDAPALATADIGISMGISGSALATETGHITLMSNDIRKVPQAIRLARQTLWKIRQNVGLSFVTKAAILTLAFCGHPILWAAVLADVGTCLLVIFNSMLILQGTTKHKRIHKSSCSKKGNGHASHNGCGHSTHDKHEHGHGAKHEHGHGAKHVHKPCCNTNHVQEKTCAHADPTSTCGQKKVQTCTSRSSCKTADSAGCGKGNVCSGDETLLQSESSDRKCCGSGTVGHESPSHVIQINEIERVETCENHSNDEVLCGLTNRDECSTTSHQTKKPCQGHPTSEDDGHDHHHHHHHHHDLHRHLSEKPCQGHATSEDNGHGNDHHHHHHHHHHDHHQHDHHHHQRAIPLNDGIKTTTTTMYGGCLHNRCRTCILPDTSIIIA